MDAAYTYKQEIPGQSFAAASSHTDMQLLTGGLRPLVGGAAEVAKGVTSSVDLGIVNGQDVTLSNNSITLFDAMITAVLRENRKAVTALPAITSSPVPSQAVSTGNEAEPRSTIIGQLGTYFGKVVSCNMPWNKLEDEVSGQSSNCPTLGQAVDNVLVATAESLVEAVNGVAQDAKRLKAVMGVAAVVLAGEAEAPVLVAKLATDTAIAQAIGGFAANFIASKAGSSEAQQEAMHAGLEAAEEGLKDFFNDKIDSGLGAILKPVDETLEQDYKTVQTGFDADEQLGIDPRPSLLATMNTLTAETKEFVSTLLAPRDDTNPDGSNIEDDSVPNDPAQEITGRVQDGSGGPLENVTVQLNNGDDGTAPEAVASTQTDGSYDLLVPVGASIFSPAQFEVVTMDESGDQDSFVGNTVDLGRGSQNLGTVTLSYDSDDDGDDDSDGTDRPKPPQTMIHAGQSQVQPLPRDFHRPLRNAGPQVLRPHRAAR
jgi:hypothetical protein